MNDEELLKELEKRFNNNKQSLLELEQLYSQLKVVNKKLEESEELKSHFISNIRNEIINPFASIMGLAKELSILNKADLEKVNSFGKMIYYEAFDLDFQLKNIFAAAAIEAGDLSPDITEIDIDKFFKNIIQFYHVKASDKKIVLDYDYEDLTDSKSNVFKTDAEKLRLIITNLLINAIDNSNESSGKVIIKVRLNHESLMFSVKDFGKGIKDEDLEIIFDRFKRLNTHIHTLNKGHGLGLSIAGSYAEILGGNIKVESQLNIGSSFNVFISEANDNKPRLGFVEDDAEFFTDNEEMIF
jgi:signal transduction histidine kinase